DREMWAPVAIACAVGLLFVPAEGRAGRPHHTAGAIAASVIAAGAFVALVALIPREPYHVEPVGIAVGAGESFVLDAPLPSRAIDVVVSGANVSGLPAGTRIGTLQVVDAAGEAFARPIEVGDLADWGAFRPGDLFRTRNPLPRRPGWTIAGEGRDAALRGEGRLAVRVDRPIRRMIVAAAPSLPPDARLQIERMEVGQP
ncbi:MAG TPA: hypothetical protein VGF40_16975, partial [Thermoanaerobaculia bacterium]